MTIPTLHTFVVGEVATASNVNNNTVTLGNFLLAPPLAILSQSAAQSIANATATGLTFNTETIDTDNGHSTVTNTSRYTGQTPGYYLLTGVYDAAPNATGARQLWFRLNGTGAEVGFEDNPAGSSGASDTALSSSDIVFLNGTTDYVEAVVSQSSGAALNTGTAHGGSRLTVLWVHT